MNSGMSEQSKSVGETGGRIVWQAMGILIAAGLLGIAYNHSSPLGVRWPKPKQPVTPATLNQVTAPSGLPSALPSSNDRRTDPRVNEGALTNLPSWNPIPTSPAVTAIPATPAGELQFPELKWPAVKALLAARQIVLIDARLAETFALSAIPGAVSLPAYSPVEDLRTFAAKHSRDTRFVIYCNSDTCDMSHELAGKLARQFGFTNLTIMPGGFAEYVIAESGTANPPSQ